jgi:hypothetical protein
MVARASVCSGIDNRVLSNLPVEPGPAPPQTPELPDARHPRCDLPTIRPPGATCLVGADIGAPRPGRRSVLQPLTTGHDDVGPGAPPGSPWR